MKKMALLLLILWGFLFYGCAASAGQAPGSGRPAAVRTEGCPLFLR
jgi:hypothetical protein